MSRPKAFFLILGMVAVAGFFYLSNKPQASTIPFASIIQRKADYRPPMEGVTLYPTDGPYGVGVIQTIAAGSGETLFVGTYGEGLFRSEDGGKHWAPSNLGLGDKFIVNLMRVDGGTLYAGTIRAGLFKSRDDGRRWVSINRGLENTSVESMVSLPGGVVYAGTGQGVYVSKDEGTHWESFNDGIGSVLVRSIVATKDGTLYAGTQGKGIYKRRPRDSQWTQIIRAFDFQGIEEQVIRALVLGKDEALYAGTLGAGIFRSRDGGVRWQRANAGLPNISIRSLSVDGRGILYAGTGEGVFYSEDDGARWLPLEAGTEMTDIQIHSFVAGERGDLYAGTGGGLFRGRIRSPWEALHQGLLIAPVRTLDYAEGEITVGTDGKGVITGQGGNWIGENVGLVNLSVRGMARGKTFLYIITEDGISRRQHGRGTWAAAEGSLPARVLSIAVDGTERIYAGTEAGLFYSSDHGKGWEKVEAVESGAISALAVKGEMVLAMMENTLWSKSNEGWKKVVSKEGAPFRYIAWRDEGHFLAANEQKIWEGDLNGEWREMKGAFPNEVRITALSVDPKYREIVYIGTERGLFWSNDGGAEWHPARLYQGERFEKQVNQLLPLSDGTIWVATEENGVLLGVDRIPKGGLLAKLRKRLG
ncbi:MAG: YCF48-related protein [Candidatus Manganitrophus sp. SA1]|nr:YCF48-related protein [Candidatus Manganitrophus morganii]